MRANVYACVLVVVVLLFFLFFGGVLRYIYLRMIVLLVFYLSLYVTVGQ